MQTGWIAEEPEEAPAGGFAGFILVNRAPQGEGRTLDQVFARAALARDREPEPAVDADDRMAGLLSRGYVPGQISQLSIKLAEVQSELAEEEGKLEKAARRAERTRLMHERGQLTGFDIMNRSRDDDDGDEDRVRQLTHRAASLWRQIGEAQAMISAQPQRDLDPVGQAASRARRSLAEVTRAMQAGVPERVPERRPFGSVSRGAGRSAEHTGPDCSVCAAARERDAARDRAAFAAVYPEVPR